MPGRTHLDRADPCQWRTLGESDRLVEIAHVDQHEAAELFLSLGEGAIGGRHSPVANTYRYGLAYALERASHDQDTFVVKPLVIGCDLLFKRADRLRIFGKRDHFLLVQIYEAHIAHGVSLHRLWSFGSIENRQGQRFFLDPSLMTWSIEWFALRQAGFVFGRWVALWTVWHWKGLRASA